MLWHVWILRGNSQSREILKPGNIGSYSFSEKVKSGCGTGWYWIPYRAKNPQKSVSIKRLRKTILQCQINTAAAWFLIKTYTGMKISFQGSENKQMLILWALTELEFLIGPNWVFQACQLPPQIADLILDPKITKSFQLFSFSFLPFASLGPNL